MTGGINKTMSKNNPAFLLAFQKYLVPQTCGGYAALC